MDVIAMGKSLAVNAVNSFNAATPNFAGLKYYSYANKMARQISSTYINGTYLPNYLGRWIVLQSW